MKVKSESEVAQSFSAKSLIPNTYGHISKVFNKYLLNKINMPTNQEIKNTLCSHKAMMLFHCNSFVIST